MINLTFDEQIGWDYIKTFLYPNSKLDHEAVMLFINGYQNVKSGRYSYPNKDQNQIEAVGALLKYMLPENHPDTFRLFFDWYTKYRQEKMPYFESWFKSIDDEEEKSKVSTLIKKSISNTPPMDARIYLMLDGLTYFPDESPTEFVTKAILKIKSSSFIKSLRPTASNMSSLLNVADTVAKISDDYKNISDTIKVAVLTQGMSTKPSSSSSQKAYSITESFTFVLNKTTMMEPKTLIPLIKSRLKGAYFDDDMLTYVDWAYNKNPKSNWLMSSPTDKDKEYAKDIFNYYIDLWAVNKSTNGNLQVMVSILNSLKGKPEFEDFYVKTKAWLNNFISKLQKKNSYPSGFIDFMELKDFEEEELFNLYVQHNNPNEKFTTYLSKDVLLKQKNYYDSSEAFTKMMKKYASSQDIKNAFYETIETIFNRQSYLETIRSSMWRPDQNEVEQRWVNNVKACFENLSIMLNPEMTKDEGFKSYLVASTMAYLYYAIQNSKEDLKNGIFIDVNTQPIPLYMACYPEQAELLNNLRKSLLRGEDYKNELYTKLGNVFYNSAVINKVLMETVVESFDLGAFMYFKNCQVNETIDFSLVDGDVFSMDM